MITLSQWSGFASAGTGGVGNRCMIDLEIRLSEGTDSAGIMVRAREHGQDGYYIRLEPKRGRFLFDREGRLCEHTEIDRFVPVATESWHHLKVILDGSVLLAYLDNAHALSARAYDFKGPELLLFAVDGEARFRNVTIRPYAGQDTSKGLEG